MFVCSSPISGLGEALYLRFLCCILCYTILSKQLPGFVFVLVCAGSFS